MKFCDCGQMLDIFDDIEQRKLFYYCSKCEYKIPFDTTLIFTKNTVNIQKKWNKYDNSLPITDKKCYKCNSLVIYEKRPDLTLQYFCTNCNETWY